MTKHISYLGATLIAVVLISGALTTPNDNRKALGSYDLVQTQNNLESTLATNPADEQALYSLARVYYIAGQYDKSLAAIAEYKKQYPENKRIHYVAGLANAYAGNLSIAEDEFLTFIDSGLSTWPGHLDLAWVYFQQGEFSAAQKTLDEAVDEFGENAWLNTSLGAVALARDDTERALSFLTKAQAQAETITRDDWAQNYSYNNPAEYENEIAQMKIVIETNLAFARGDHDTAGNTVTEALRAPFANASPLGVSKGLAVSACGDSCGVTSCISGANICGQIATGTQSTCGGNVCSATVPANPAGTCSVATQCGNATGFVGCNGGCNVTRFPVCLSATNPSGTGEVTWIVLDDGSGGGLGVTDIAADLSVFPALVNPGGQTAVRWVSTETVECTVTGENGDEWIGPVVGEEISGFITEETDYTLTCEGYDGSTVTDTATVRIVPDWQEF